MRDFFYQVKRIYFWVLCPLVVLLAGIVWFLGVSGLSEQQKRNRQEIDSLYSTVGTLRSEAPHPNSKVSEGMQSLIQTRREEVDKAWSEKYKQQTSEQNGTLAWPTELKPELIARVKPLHPIESKVDHPVLPEDDLILSLRRNYQEHVDKELPRLAESIGAKWLLTPESESGPGYPGGEGGRSENVYGTSEGQSAAELTLVEWSAQSQQEILQQHFRWEDSAAFGGGRPGEPGLSSLGSGETREPNLLEILYAQEDLWILQAIMNVITKTNEGATARFNAAIKEIEFIRMGKPAVKSNGKISTVDDFEKPANAWGGGGGEGGREPGGYGGEGEGEPYAGGGEREPSMEGWGEEGGAPSDAPATPDPAENRYVDRDYQPLSAADLRQVMKEPASVDPERAYLAVAKRIPVRLRVKIDQTKLESFLIQCANSPLTIEVREVRINPDDDGSLASAAGIGGENFQMPNRQEGGLLTGDDNVADAIDAQSRTDLTVEIYGIVYFFNPVDKGLLNSEEAAEAGEEPLAAVGP